MVGALADEARRQLDVERRERHALVPVFRSAAASALPGGAEDAICALDSALASAREARTADELGPAEERLTAAVEAVGAALRDAAPDSGGSPAKGSASAASAAALHHELRSLEHQLASAVRHCNHSVRACERLRSGIASLPVRGSFEVPPRVCYAPAEYDDAHGGLAAAVPCGDESSRTPGAEGYRPGPVGEDL